MSYNLQFLLNVKERNKNATEGFLDRYLFDSSQFGFEMDEK